MTTATSATFSFKRTGSGPFRCSLDGSTYTLCASPWSVNGLSLGTHTFSVYAFNDSLIGPAASVAWSVGASSSGPSAPTGLAASAGNAQVSLSWSASSASAGIAGYRVFRNGTQVAQMTTTSDTDTGLTNGTTYTYTVQAVDNTGAVSAASAAVSATPQAPTVAPPPSGGGGSVTFQAMFDGLASSQLVTPQCANYGTLSQSSRYRGTWNYDTRIVGQGSASVRIDAPATPSGYSLTDCNDDTPAEPNVLGSDAWQGIMVYVPQGWSIPNNSQTGVNFFELHFQNVYGAPLTLQLHQNSVVVGLETGACSNHTTTNPGCQYRGNVTCSKVGSWICEPTTYAIPPGALVQGQWNEIIVHTHWSACGGVDACAAGQTPGSFDTYYKVKGASTWNTGSSLSNLPTVQWDVSVGSSPLNYRDQYELYTSALSAPLSLWLDGVVDGSSFQAVANQLP